MGHGSGKMNEARASRLAVKSPLVVVVVHAGVVVVVVDAADVVVVAGLGRDWRVGDLVGEPAVDEDLEVGGGAAVDDEVGGGVDEDEQVGQRLHAGHVQGGDVQAAVVKAVRDVEGLVHGHDGQD